MEFLKEEAILLALCEGLENTDLVYDIPGATEEEAMDVVDERVQELSRFVSQKRDLATLYTVKEPLKVDFIKERAILTALCDGLENGDLIYDLPGTEDDDISRDSVYDEAQRLSKILSEKMK